MKVPFLYDFDVDVRFLFSLPLLIWTELIIYRRMRAITAQFVERQIITEHVRPAFQAAMSSAMRLRNSLPAEIGLLLLVFVAGPIPKHNEAQLVGFRTYGRLASD